MTCMGEAEKAVLGKSRRGKENRNAVEEESRGKDEGGQGVERHKNQQRGWNVGMTASWQKENQGGKKTARGKHAGGK